MFDRIMKLAVTVIPPAHVCKSSCPPRLIVPRRGAGKVSIFRSHQLKLREVRQFSRGHTAPRGQNRHGISADGRWPGQVLVEGRAGGRPGPRLTALATHTHTHTHTHPSPRRSLSPRRCCGTHLP